MDAAFGLFESEVDGHLVDCIRGRSLISGGGCSNGGMGLLQGFRDEDGQLSVAFVGIDIFREALLSFEKR